jgi:beta-xylosidase
MRLLPKLGVAALAAVVATLPIAMPAATAAAQPFVVGAHPTAPAFQPSWATTVRQTDAPDPDVVRFGSTYYAYTTGTEWGNHIGILTSAQPNTAWRTITNTQFASSAFPSVPPGQSVRPWQVNGSQHAPGVFFVGGRYIMFYTAETTSGHGGHYCLSVATAAAPTGPFVDTSAGPTLCDDADGGTIDPSPFIDGS